MVSTVYKEQMVLEDRRYWLYTLHDELRRNPDYTSNNPRTIQLMHNDQQAVVKLRYFSSLIEGCIEWENIRGHKERECLYAKPQ